jgi:predicted ATP-dependent serine protease
VYNAPLLEALELRGLIHIWGDAGSGKTLLAVAIACDASKHSRVEWINSDAKKSFVTHLKKNISASGGRIENITINLTESRSELNALIDDLPRILNEPSVVIIDPITRVLDMAREDPVLWGREIIEEVLPTLSGIVAHKNVDIIIISESRMMEDSTNQAVHHRTISRWVDRDICLERNMHGSQTKISRLTDDGSQELAVMKVDSNGIIEIAPQLPILQRSRGEKELVW